MNRLHPKLLLLLIVIFVLAVSALGGLGGLDPAGWTWDGTSIS
jgi:hypothetical protein